MNKLQMVCYTLGILYITKEDMKNKSKGDV